MPRIQDNPEVRGYGGDINAALKGLRGRLAKLRLLAELKERRNNPSRRDRAGRRSGEGPIKD